MVLALKRYSTTIKNDGYDVYEGAQKILAIKSGKIFAHTWFLKTGKDYTTTVHCYTVEVEALWILSCFQISLILFYLYFLKKSNL